MGPMNIKRSLAVWGLWGLLSMAPRVIRKRLKVTSLLYRIDCTLTAHVDTCHKVTKK